MTANQETAIDQNERLHALVERLNVVHYINKTRTVVFVSIPIEEHQIEVDVESFIYNNWFNVEDIEISESHLSYLIDLKQ